MSSAGEQGSTQESTQRAAELGDAAASIRSFSPGSLRSWIKVDCCCFAPERSSSRRASIVRCKEVEYLAIKKAEYLGRRQARPSRLRRVCSSSYSISNSNTRMARRQVAQESSDDEGIVQPAPKVRALPLLPPEPSINIAAEQGEPHPRFLPHHQRRRPGQLREGR